MFQFLLFAVVTLWALAVLPPLGLPFVLLLLYQVVQMFRTFRAKMVIRSVR